MQHPRVLELHFALQRLRSIVTFMNSGAHPDDETSAMLAALGFRDGLDISYACANRGEGGQNDIGTESGAALGTLRTAEMQRAAAVLNMRLYWLSSSVNDAISDFRFSKSGIETLQKWGHEHTLSRFVSIVRREKPDVLCPTFLDIPGQHGHHRAMTQLAHEVVSAAADPAYRTEHNGSSLAPWSITKLYLPAWGGGGNAYDDELPPPEPTLQVQADGVDSVSGWSWERIGQQSRRYHLTQGMGRWIAAGTERNWPLHLAYSVFNGADNAIADHLPSTLSQLASYANTPEIEEPLDIAQGYINEAISSFPDYNAVLLNASSALSHIRLAQQHCPVDAAVQVQHRLARKVSQLSRVIRIASGIDVHAVAGKDRLRPGESSSFNLEIRQPVTNPTIALSCAVSLETNERWVNNESTLTVKPNATPSNPYPAEYFPDDIKAPAVEISVDVNGVISTSTIEMVNTPIVLPPKAINLSANSIIINRQSDNREFCVDIEHCIPSTASVSLSTPDGWTHSVSASRVSVTVPADVAAGTYQLDVLLDGQPALSEQLIDYPHTQLQALTAPAKLTVLILDVLLPTSRIAYVGGGNDRIAEYLSAMGLHITELDDSALGSTDALAQYSTLVVGLFAMRTRPALQENIHTLHNWIEQGGHLLTMYHRPWDNWNPDIIPPRFLEIGQPSLRFRVTNENAEVTHLQADHELLNKPNTISTEDWQNWHKERGLYFAKKWHSDYQALLSMSDPDEAPLEGSLLSAEIGAGRHTHTSLVLHHQMAKLVPGSFRIMANLLS